MGYYCAGVSNGREGRGWGGWKGREADVLGVGKTKVRV